MAVPADVREQLAEREARLRVVSVGEVPPPAEVREQVQRWQEHVHEVAGTIRWADGTIAQLAGTAESVERDRMLALVRSVRAQAFDLMRHLNPDQAWFWTEEWQAGEREVDREVAAGPGQIFTTEEEFEAALDALDAQRTHAD